MGAGGVLGVVLMRPNLDDCSIKLKDSELLPLPDDDCVMEEVWMEDLGNSVLE